MSPLPIFLATVAAVSFVFAVISALKAWSLSFGYPDFDRLGGKKWVMGMFVIRHMPPAAMPYIRRYFIAFAVFMLAILGIIIHAAVNGNPLP